METMETMQNVMQLNTTKPSLSMTKVQNRLVNSVANVSNDMNVKFNKVNINLESNSVKLDGFQKVVVTLNKR